MTFVQEENGKMIEMPITLEPYESYCNRLIEETHKMVKEMHDIVHCKDCRHWSKAMLYCWELENNMNADDFCSRGKRKKPTEF